jgi:hypothetical protein
MADRARVLSVDAMKDAKACLVEFMETCGGALMSVDADINRVTAWLQQQVGHWKRELRKREDEVNKVKTDIMRKKIIAAPEPASVVEEEKFLRRAKSRLESAQRKLEAVRRWAPVWEREAMLYKTSTHRLSEALHADLPAALVRLERMFRALEEYTRLTAPKGEDAETIEPLATDEGEGDERADAGPPGPPSGEGEP